MTTTTTTTTLRGTGGILGSETMLVRCDLTDAASPITYSTDNGATWHQHAGFTAADVHHMVWRLREHAEALAIEQVGECYQTDAAGRVLYDDAGDAIPLAVTGITWQEV